MNTYLYLRNIAFYFAVQRSVQFSTLPVYIDDCKQDIIEISSDKKVCVRRSVLGYVPNIDEFVSWWL